MVGTIIGTIAGAFFGYLIVAVATDGPKYPGDTSATGGPGCLVSLAIVIGGAVVGGLAGTAIQALI